MEWHWPFAILLVALMLFGYCTYSTHEASRSIDRAFDSFDRQICYETGYNAAITGKPRPSMPRDNPDCATWLQSGYSDGRRIYRSYEDRLN